MSDLDKILYTADLWQLIISKQVRTTATVIQVTSPVWMHKMSALCFDNQKSPLV